jgi:Polyketide cyclase / dehydrase and lipid transport
MKTWTADSPGTVSNAWALISQPERWHEWAPHVRGAWGLSRQVRAGDRGAVRLLGVVPVPVEITRVDPGHAWTWRVGGLVEMDHRVEPGEPGCTVALDLRAPAPLEAGLALAYGPVISATLRRLASSC